MDEHKPSTTTRQRNLFWAALAIPPKLFPCSFSLSSVSRIQLLLSRPLFSFPCGFQVRAWRVVLDAGFLRVCPIQPHFLRKICFATGSCPARSNRSSFLIFSGYLMRLRQVLKNAYFLQHCFCCTLCLISMEENILHVGDEDAEFGSCVDSLGCPDVLKHVK